MPKKPKREIVPIPWAELQPRIMTITDEAELEALLADEREGPRRSAQIALRLSQRLGVLRRQREQNQLMKEMTE